ncbi:hypothetical protein [Endozoicomonas numazuensis]|uniref:Flagellar protein FliT n=1 Tax=Endozoicomonas numazuensis TaxID=1137799 RepID=A0A081ND18_9GAMM|nr:hypothetical protein [Endozoicomonas numazuensis]KEQ16341.1 hypothetical protein GZ78_20890 [Endozoicomonas numazuensis]
MKNPDIVKEKLQEAIHNLSTATRNKDWTTLEALDSEARQAIEDALENGSSPSEEVKRLLGDLQMLYQEMISACQLERDHIQEQLMASKRRQAAIDSYQQSDKSRG